MSRPASSRRTATVVLLVGVLASGATTLAACGGTSAATGPDGTGPPDDLGEIVDLSGKAEIAVGVPDNSFKPRAFRVTASSKVVFTNTGANAHNITPNDDGAWEPVVVGSGESRTLTVPARTGPYRFYCTIHGTKTSGQRGAMIVVAPG